MNIKKQIRRGLPLVGVPPYGQIHLHSTGNPNSTAQNEADYMNRKNINTGYFTHVVGNGQVIQTAETNRGAWDVGGGWNQWGYASIELIESHKTQAEFDRDYKLYVELARKLADEAKIPKKLDRGELGIITHDYARRHQPYNQTDHVDPYPYLAKWGISREQLRKDIENGISKPSGNKPEGDWIRENKRVKINTRHEKIYSGFNWKLRTLTKDVYGREYNVTGKYHHQNGFVYYSLYDDKGNWHGYINSAFVTEVKPKTNVPSKGKWIAERGKFYVGVPTKAGKSIPVNKLPLTVNATGSGAKIADIPRGQYIVYDAFMNDGKYLWIRQPRANGTYGYMATGNIGSNGYRKDYWGDFR